MDLGLKGKSVIVAASSQGIGKAAAERFASQGANVAMCARNQANLDAAANTTRLRFHNDVFAKALDVTDSKAVHEFVEEVAERFGGVDVCVTNAGGPPAKGFQATTPEEWERAVQLNLLSVVQMAREVLPYMQKKKWGRIVTLTSVSVKQPIADLVMSNAVRAGVVGLVKSLANEFGRDGITVNNVAPGYTETDRLKGLANARAAAAGITPEEVRKRWIADVPLGRLGRPEEIANAIVWLASECASYITGQTLLVDGGVYKGV